MPLALMGMENGFVLKAIEGCLYGNFGPLGLLDFLAIGKEWFLHFEKKKKVMAMRHFVSDKRRLFSLSQKLLFYSFAFRVRASFVASRGVSSLFSTGQVFPTTRAFSSIISCPSFPFRAATNILGPSRPLSSGYDMTIVIGVIHK